MNITCADCRKENCNKPGGWHISYWLKYRTKDTLLETTDNEPSIFEAASEDNEMLSALCKELGWQGGTIYQVADEILKRMKLSPLH